MKPILVAWGVAGALALALAWDSSVKVLHGPHDSSLYVERADDILEGEVAPYDPLVLMRLPGYPALLAFNGRLGWPLHVTQQVLHLLSVLALLIALHAVGVPRRLLAALAVLSAFHPAFFVQTTIAYSEGLSTPALTASVAALLGLLAASGAGAGLARTSQLMAPLAWSALLAVSLSVLWNTRPDSVVVVPSALLVAILWVRFAWRTPGRGSAVDLVRVLFLLLAPVIAVYATSREVAHLNLDRYGFEGRYELEETNFRSAFETLARLAPESRIRQVPVSRAGLEAACEHSPSFLPLERYLSWQKGGKGFTGPGCRQYELCDEFVGGVAFIALRHAAWQAGMHASAEAASDFYGRVHRELEEACSEGALSCSANPTGTLYSTPLRLEDLPHVAASAGRVGWDWLTLGGLYSMTQQLSVPREVDEELVGAFRRVTHDVDSPWRYWAGRATRVHMLSFAALQILVLPLALVAGVRWWKQRPSRSRFGPALACLLLVVAGQLALVAFLDAMGLPFRIRFLLPIYPATLALLGVLVAHLRPPRPSLPASAFGETDS